MAHWGGFPSGASCNGAVEGDLHPAGPRHWERGFLQPGAAQDRAGTSPQGPHPTVGSGGVVGAGVPGVSRCPVHGISCSATGGKDGRTPLTCARCSSAPAGPGPGCGICCDEVPTSTPGVHSLHNSPQTVRPACLCSQEGPEASLPAQDEFSGARAALSGVRQHPLLTENSVQGVH